MAKESLFLHRCARVFGVACFALVLLAAIGCSSVERDYTGGLFDVVWEGHGRVLGVDETEETVTVDLSPDSEVLQHRFSDPSLRPNQIVTLSYWYAEDCHYVINEQIEVGSTVEVGFFLGCNERGEYAGCAIAPVENE
ncbi:MAG: hypothetical protein K6F70_00240 [Eggerthellaceae bacterium]|nr:hypothetical protein [Eggerthellaceae bacterium]